MSKCLGNPVTALVDGENNPVEFDFAYPVRGSLPAALTELEAIHHGKLFILPLSGTSCGGGILQCAERPEGSIVGLLFDPPTSARVRRAVDIDLAQLELDEIVIDADRQQICAGASVTLEQLNQALSDELGHAYRVPGADLTSYQYAAVGATFMTGGMGPQRRYFSDSVSEAAIYDGASVNRVGGEDLEGFAGTYGWSGVVCALRCDYYEYPANEIAFALPVSGDPDRLARLLAALAPFAYLQLAARETTVSQRGTDLLLGLEHVSLASLGPLLDSGGEQAARAADLRRKCLDAGGEGLIFVNGLTGNDIDDFLLGLLDDPACEDPTIGGVSLQHAEIFRSAEEMRLLREAVPYAARMQARRTRFGYKSHSDANIKLDPSHVAAAMTRLWQHNRDYVQRVESYFCEHNEIHGQILVYGHLNPSGVDPHNRVTMHSDDEQAFAECRAFLIEARAQYYRDLAGLCADGEAEFIGGEKTADSEMAIFAALGGPQQAPAALRQRFLQQREKVRSAAQMFNWRAPASYL